MPIRVCFRSRASSARVRRCRRPIVKMQEMDALDLLFERLVRAARDSRPELLTRPFEVSELIELVPYKAVRAEGALETNDDYSHALTRLLAGERGYLFADDLLQDDLRA